jgi:hypothetical protein
VLEVWRRSQSPLRTAVGEITVVDQLTQHDTWQYKIAVRDTAVTIPSDGRAWPVVVSAEHARRIQLSLECDGDRLLWQCHLKPSAKLALVTRRIDVNGTSAPAVTAEASPVDTLAESIYRRAGRRIVGHVQPSTQTAADVNWPGVLIGADQ